MVSLGYIPHRETIHQKIFDGFSGQYGKDDKFKIKRYDLN